MTDAVSKNSPGQTISPGPIKARLGPIGFHMFAVHFLWAAQAVPPADHRFSPVPYYLYCRAIELALKAFLLAKGVPENRLKRKFGHDLERLLKRANTLGLSGIVPLDPVQEREIQRANQHYGAKRFEYFELLSAVLGHSDLPDLNIVAGTAESLVEKLEPVCVAAANE